MSWDSVNEAKNLRHFVVTLLSIEKHITPRIVNIHFDAFFLKTAEDAKNAKKKRRGIIRSVLS